MSATPDAAPRRSDFPACKAIYCVLPDDGTDKRLLVELRDKQGVVRAGSETCRGIGVLAEVITKRGKLPEPRLVKKLFVVCSEEQADEIFDFVFWYAQLDKPAGGVIWQQALNACTPYELPPDVPDESAGISRSGQQPGETQAPHS